MEEKAEEKTQAEQLMAVMDSLYTLLTARLSGTGTQVTDLGLLEMVGRARSIPPDPLRNCDVYRTPRAAWQAWLDDKDNWTDFGSEVHSIQEWLLAPVKKKKNVVHCPFCGADIEEDACPRA